MQNRSPSEGEIRILLIQNEPDDVELLAHAIRLTHLDIRLSIVTDGKSGMDYILGKGVYGDRIKYPFPDAIILGLLLPVISGVEFLKWRRRTELCKRVPLFVWTGAVEGDKVIQEALDFGVDRLYYKSGEMKELTTVIREIYDRVLQVKANSRAA